MQQQSLWQDESQDESQNEVKITWEFVADEIESALPVIFDKIHRARMANNFEFGNYLEQTATVWMIQLQEARKMALQDKIDNLNVERKKALEEHRFQASLPAIRALCQEIEKSHPHYRVKWSEERESYILVKKLNEDEETF